MDDYVKGERFYIPLDEDDSASQNDLVEGTERLSVRSGGKAAANDTEREQGEPEPEPVPLLVSDVLERPNAGRPNPPAPPSFPTHKNGTPQPRKFGAARVSRFKASRQKDAPAAPAAAPARPQTEREQIDAENKERISKMSASEIEEARREIMSFLSPEMVDRLLKRTKPLLGGNTQILNREEKDEAGEEEADQDKEKVEKEKTDEQTSEKTEFTSQKEISGICDLPSTLQAEEPRDEAPAKKAVSFDLPDEPREKPATAEPVESLSHEQPGSIHFPRPPEPPKLDPSSPHFLADLQSHYFPSLSHDPTKLEWMGHVVPPPRQSMSSTIPISALRFDMAGQLLSVSSQERLPTNIGLHHHGADPDKAGYTITELATLGRSSYAPQRCIAFMLLGRILYRLGNNEFGQLDGNVDTAGLTEEQVKRQIELSELAQYLAEHIEKQGAVDLLLEEVRLEGRGHTSSKTYAEEAIWLWRKAGAPAWTENAEEKEAMDILARKA